MSSRQLKKQARRNGALAAGAKSPEGIKKSALNAFRHGLTAKTIVLSNESQTKFDELMEAFIRKFQPQDEVELELVTEMVAARWRLRRIWVIQTAALNHQMDKMEAELSEKFELLTEPTRLSLAFTTMANQERSLQLLLRYETTYSRAFDRAHKTLEKMQKTRTESTRTEELRNEPDTPLPTTPTEPEASAPGNENCETNPSPQPPRPVDVIIGPNPRPIPPSSPNEQCPPPAPYPTPGDILI